MALVREQTMRDRRFLAKQCQLLGIEGVAWSAQRIPTVVNLDFLDRSRYFFFQVAPQLSSRGWVDPVPDPPLLRKSGSAGNWTQDLWICSQKLWPLHHRGGLFNTKHFSNTVTAGINFSCPKGLKRDGIRDPPLSWWQWYNSPCALNAG
jgi:hypothetical protein